MPPKEVTGKVQAAILKADICSLTLLQPFTCHKLNFRCKKQGSNFIAIGSFFDTRYKLLKIKSKRLHFLMFGMDFEGFILPGKQILLTF